MAETITYECDYTPKPGKPCRAKCSGRADDVVVVLRCCKACFELRRERGLRMQREAERREVGNG